ncbi:MAG: 2-oxoglutarate ferredoxin oxidoreductase subunit alpha [Candidatus Marinimicrobia bacterium]|nr:2-oxoglutarate ferredoxin oxidoreductase subunit alpha [Candidatus Neomarinimicrobiota bacterium]
MNDKNKNLEELDIVTIRFAGDSGDGMQLTGNQFSDNTALFGNDLTTLPDFPAEIRAPAGSLAGVSSFQMQFSSKEVYTPGDSLDVLVAMNPAAFKVHLCDLKENGMLIVNTKNYSQKNLKLAGYESNPLDSEEIADKYKLIKVDMSELVMKALEDMELDAKSKSRCTNMFALGLLYWLYERDMQTTISFLEKKFKSKPAIVEANSRALKAGFNFGDTIEAIRTTYKIQKADFKKGHYRNIMGNPALSMGLLVASEKSGTDLFFGGYPITPASDILHFLSKYKNLGVKTFQAEDEIAGICSVLGASYAGNLGITASSGPGIALKGEAMGLAVMTELPVVILNIQRGGPSTGLPTKTEQSDLMQAMYGRNGEAPIVVLAPQSPGDCFYIGFEACRIALEYMVPVMVLSDGYLANGSEPWEIPELNKMPKIKTNKIDSVSDTFMPYDRDDTSLARPWAIPGKKGLEHRIGGLETENISGHVNYSPENHEFMVQLRNNKINAVLSSIPDIVPFGDENGDILVLGWGSTFGAIRTAVEKLRNEGKSVSHVQLRYINPLPKNLGNVLLKYKKVIVPELNLGQLNLILRSKYLVNSIGLNKVQGKPFTVEEIYNKIIEV